MRQTSTARAEHGKRVGLGSIFRMLAAAGVALSPSAARAIDIAPGDYAVLPAGTSLGALYFQYTSADSLHVIGPGDVPASELKTAVGILRGLHFTEVGGVPIALHLILPFGGFPEARIGGVEQPTAEGFGDVTTGFTIYPINTGAGEFATTVGLSAFVTMPTGHHDFGRISIGSGAWTATPQVGLIQGLGHGFFFDGAADVAFRRDSEEAGNLTVSQDPSFQLQAYLRYQVSQATSVSFGYSGTFGGDSFVNDRATGLQTRSDQLRLFANTFVTPTVQIQGMIGTDIHAEGGFKQDLVAQIRLLTVF
ncbi:transporter [Aureimonas sp. D3]|uniref:transporter n=1 Tax=Aureimonas sp. D3 TaxID=1638164 RepID=UPI0009EA56E7|nr:transporter [Aureimonas sp. D3]